ncbi:MAG: hypothetical protein L0Z53_23470 [Acidobacteriales bacterium]|nr:hypothetical protein [Terriglobales bacterium]
MAKARITRTDGTKIVVEGTAEEVARLVEQLGTRASTTSARSVGTKRATKVNERQKPTLIGHIGSLIDGGFFRKPKDLGSVKQALDELGHFYPVTTISPIMLRLVRRRQLRRIKEKNRWLYTG